MNITDLKDKEFKGNEFLGPMLLVPNANKLNTNRGVMWCAHFDQAPVLANKNNSAEIPLVFSRFENQIGKYSSGYKKADKDYTVEAKFVRNKYSYDLVVSDSDGYFDVIHRNESKWLTEKYGYKWDNCIDYYEEQDTIEKDTVLYSNTSYDEEHNLCFGKNLRAMFYAYKDKTHEDAIVMSESAALKMGYYSVCKPVITLNTNDLLLNKYGNKSHYKAFPDIGETIINQELCIRRRIVYDKILTSMKNLNDYQQGDDTFYASGKVVDIEIYSNMDMESLKGYPYYDQIRKYLVNDINYYKEIVESLQDLVENDTEYCSNELIRYYNNAKKKLDEYTYYTFESNKFDGIIIKFTVMYEKKVYKGIKFTGRYGNKGVVSEIIPDDQMPVIEEGPFKGLRAEVILNPLGVIGRMNPCQLFELEINFISMFIRKAIDDAETLTEKKNIFLQYHKNVSPLLAEFDERFFKETDDEELLEFFEECVERGIPVYQGPFTNNINIYDLAKLYDKYSKYGIKPFKFKGIKNPIIMGEMYFLRLKHEPSNKDSARSTSFTDLKDLPAKDKEFTDFKALFPHTPIKLGEQEVMGLMLSKNVEAVKEILYSYATNMNDSEKLEREQLTGNPFNVKFKPTGTQANTVKIMNELLYSLGLKLELNNEEEDK